MQEQACRELVDRLRSANATIAALHVRAGLMLPLLPAALGCSAARPFQTLPMAKREAQLRGCVLTSVPGPCRAKDT